MVECVLRLGLRKERAHAVSPCLVQGLAEEGTRGVAHLQIEERAVGRVHGVAVVHVEPVEDVGRVYKAELLSGGIAQVGFREVVFQPGHHPVDAVVAVVEAQLAGPFQVGLDLGQAEAAAAEPHARHALQVGHRAVGPAVEPLAVYPHQGTAAGIVGTRALVGRHRVAVGGSQTVYFFTDAVGVEPVGRGRQRGKVGQRQVAVGVGLLVMARLQQPHHEQQEHPRAWVLQSGNANRLIEWKSFSPPCPP